MNEQLNNRLKIELNRLYKEECAKLDALYEKLPSVLREVEKDELIRLAIQFPVTIQQTVKSVLREFDVPYVNTLWQGIGEKITAPKYVYIDWESINTNNQDNYQRKISKEDYDNLAVDKTIAVAGGCLALGSVAMICFASLTNPLILVVSFVNVLSITASGIATVRIINKSKKEVKKTRNVNAEPAINIPDSTPIKFAKDENKKILSAWCKELFDIIIEEVNQ